MISSPDTTTDDRIKCLLVDDVPENLVALQALLENDRVQVLKAQSGSEALELLLNHGDVALALLDVQMPEMNGFELAELIRGSERTRHIPLIFMTAGSREHNWQFRGYETGAVDFLYKPIDPYMLSTKANVFFELHERKRALAQQLQERTEALRVNEMFMAVLSHDLRTPLQSITIAATLLQRQIDAARVSSIAGRMLQSSERMARMIEDLLDVTRIRQTGGLTVTPTRLSMQTLVQRTLDEVQTGHPDRLIEMHLDGNPLGTWDGERMCQVLANLVGNAIHHGDPAVPVRVQIDGGAIDRVTVTVSNGGTIPPDLLPHLFNPFRGGERRPGEHQGLGLGLFIAQQIVITHGGCIEAGSRDGITSFRVELPREVAPGTRKAVL
ncbi:hybrid sensor histidine kinase/response regulator [Bordetella genomosp. 5]|uniref:histidine kinase n=1 Tax=Bordetella genomosp. 5 TaxID=1395608 RepID=A0A261TRC4_9BORD|nr:hybrid sensor histidine kinase/response regulator [Bordetella genomosp. 5]OZI42431.1 hybrid sensor histidine kinase/response regulator [Bordetella genomosp. 5]OZI52169.1 hybrid sensor histidine kinase/response regulator [Bordetella genomosp. 5]